MFIKRTISAFFILISSLVNVFAQNDTINKLNENGLKKGYWINYDDMGNIKSEGHYIIIRLSNSEELFMSGIYDKDTIINKSVKDGLWKEYSIHNKILIKEYWEEGELRHVYDIENDPEYNYHHQIPESEFNFASMNLIEETGSIINSFFILPNKLKNDSAVFTQISSDRIKNICIVEEDSLKKIKFEYLIENGFQKDTLYLLSKNYKFVNESFKIYSFGYHFSCDNLSENFQKLRTISTVYDSLYYYRKNRASEMKIYKYSKQLSYAYITSGKAIPLRIIPISSNYNIINLSNLKKGKYLIRIINYRYKINKFAIIDLNRS